MDKRKFYKIKIDLLNWFLLPYKNDEFICTDIKIIEYGFLCFKYIIVETTRKQNDNIKNT